MLAARAVPPVQEARTRAKASRITRAPGAHMYSLWGVIDWRQETTREVGWGDFS